MSSVNQLGMAGIASLAGAPDAVPPGKDSARIRDAAQQFEALLLNQLLQSTHESGGGWLTSGDDSSSDCATGYAEQQLAAAMAQQGGFGLAKLIAAGLEREPSTKPVATSSPTATPF